MNKKYQKALIWSSCCLLALSNISPTIALATTDNSPTIQETTPTNSTVVTFSSSDLLQAAQKLYDDGIFTKEQYQTVFTTLTQRLGRKGVNKTVYLGNNLYDNYIDSVTWSLAVSLGAGAFGTLLGAIPGINAALAGFIASVASGVGSSYLSADRGVIIRTRQVYVPSNGVGGARIENRIVSIREQ
ncbi:hypothetical protein [Streptococcus cuniculipharyngis]|uniref:Uncharacterized protein n=1 Tax=Streptococcus cuniculipharyngis TaxID=1562651 RepID=A0A5C5SCE0_9STRE|nr:hypothetical protein [Streptococcus cuniculipharyngis]TWS97164.1 hypothetical protein FRX57_06095 [Streptococcus cuniculipharyngis]